MKIVILPACRIPFSCYIVYLDKRMIHARKESI